LKKSLSVFLTLLLLLTLVVPALAEETEGEINAEISEESVPEDTPPAPDPEPEPEPVPAPDPEPEPAPASEPEPIPEPEPEPAADPVPDQPETPAEDAAEVPVPDIEDPSPDLGVSVVPSVPGDLDAPTYDVTETPSGDVIIEEHTYTRTVDIAGALDALDLSDLTMRSALTAVFGEYQPKTQTVSTYYDGQLLDSSTEYVPGVAGMDMEWIAGVIVFTVLLYCLMKLLGGVFK